MNNKINNFRQNIGLITKPINKASLVPLFSIIDILQSISGSMCVITGGEGTNLMRKSDKDILVLSVEYIKNNNLIVKIISHIVVECKISINLVRSTKKFPIWIFFLESHSLLLPVLTAKLLRKKTIFLLGASIRNSTKAHGSALSKIFVYSEILAFELSNRIVVYAPNLIKEWNLERYKNKISIANRHFLSFENFKIQKKLDERKALVGYIGRLSEEKGVMNFVRSISISLTEIDGIKFMIGGDGRLRSEIEEILSKNNLIGNAKLLGWISHDTLPGYLNELKLLVLPSYTEGLPNIMLEAMACGTPVLANPVGAIPCIIEDGETGFLMENNSPECIASNVIRALKYPDIEGVARRARILVESEFTFDKVVERWGKVLDEMRSDV